MRTPWTRWLGACLAAVALAVPSSALAGSLEMRDGRTIEGEIRAEDGALVVRPAAGGAEVRVSQELIQRARLRSGSMPLHPVGRTDSALPDGWKSTDIGDVHRKGSASCDKNGVFTISASGWGPWGPEDSLHFVYTRFQGDGQIIARLAKVDDSHGRMSMSVMIRQTLSADAPMAAATIHPSGEVRLSRRVLTGAPEFARPEQITPCSWVRLTRRGNVFSAYRSTNGRFWQLAESRQIEMTGTTLIGLAAAMRNNVSLGTLQVDSVLIIPGTPAATWFADAQPLQQGVIFRDGTALAGTIQSADAGGVKLLRGDEQTTIAWERIAQLLFNPAPANIGADGKKGVWTVGGDFIEGELAGIVPVRTEEGWPPRLRASVRSVLLGVRQLDAARDVMLIVVNDIKAAPAAFELIAADGSTARAQKLEILKTGFKADGKDIADVSEIRRLP